MSSKADPKGKHTKPASTGKSVVSSLVAGLANAPATPPPAGFFEPRPPASLAPAAPAPAGRGKPAPRTPADTQKLSSLERIILKAEAGEPCRQPVEIPPSYLRLAAQKLSILGMRRPPLPAELAQLAFLIAENYLATDMATAEQLRMHYLEVMTRKQQRILERQMGGVVPALPGA